MPNNRQAKPKKRKRKRQERPPAESRASEAITIVWTVSVTGVLIADLLAGAAHFYAWHNADATLAAAFEAIMLVSASLMGGASLVLLRVVWHVRQVRPPQGYAVFGAMVAAAPIVALIFRLL